MEMFLDIFPKLFLIVIYIGFFVVSIITIVGYVFNLVDNLPIYIKFPAQVITVASVFAGLFSVFISFVIPILNKVSLVWIIK